VTEILSIIMAILSLVVAIVAVVVAILKLRSIQHKFEDNHVASIWKEIDSFKKDYSSHCLNESNRLTAIEKDLTYIRRDVNKLLGDKTQ